MLTLLVSSMFYRSCNSVGFIERIPFSSHGIGLSWRVYELASLSMRAWFQPDKGRVPFLTLG